MSKALYQLFVARGGDVAHRYLEADDREVAERMAAEVIAEAFGLECDDFDELVGDIDGYYLEPVEVRLVSGEKLELAEREGRLVGTPDYRKVREGWAEAAQDDPEETVLEW